MDNKNRRNHALSILSIFALFSLLSILGFDDVVARGQSILGLLVSLTGMVVVYALPVETDSLSGK